MTVYLVVDFYTGEVASAWSTEKLAEKARDRHQSIEAIIVDDNQEAFLKEEPCPTPA